MKPWWYRFPLEPQYDVALLSPDFETRAKAREQNEKRIGLLRRGTSHASIILAEKLEKCSGRSPCESAACRLCMRECRRTITGLTLMQLQGADYLRSMTVIAGAPFRDDWLEGTAAPPDPRAIKGWLRRVIRVHAPSVTLAIGGIEVDLNEDTGLAEPHAHILVPVRMKFRLGWLRAFLRRNVQKRRALRVSRFIPESDRAYATSYLWKFAPMRKYTWWRVDRHGNKKKRRGKVEMKGSAGRLALRWLDRHPPSAFVFTLGCNLQPGKFVPSRSDQAEI